MEEKNIIFTIVFLVALVFVFSAIMAHKASSTYNDLVRKCETKKGIVSVSKRGFLTEEFTCYTLGKEEMERLLGK